MKIPEKYIVLLSNMDAKTRYYIFIGVLLMVFLLDYFIIMKPQLDALVRINPKIELKVKDIDSVKKNRGKIGQYKVDVEKLKKELAVISLKVKTKEEVPIILERVSRLANKNGIKIERIMPNEQGKKTLLEESGRRYYSLPIIIVAKCEYHDFGHFLNMIEKDEIALKTGTFTISKEEGVKQQAVKLTINAIMYEEVKIDESKKDEDDDGDKKKKKRKKRRKKKRKKKK